MGRYRSLRKVKEIGEVAVMTRARAAAETKRKRKVSCGKEVVQRLSSRRRLFVSTPENSAEKAAASSNSNDPYASCCSSNGSIELDNGTSKLADLKEKAESVDVGTSTYELERCRERRETTPSSSEVRGESVEMGSASKASLSQAAVSHRQSTTDENVDKMPSGAELEEFFSKAEKKIQEEFAQKYNFDIVEEKPLEGRYEWVRVKP